MTTTLIGIEAEMQYRQENARKLASQARVQRELRIPRQRRRKSSWLRRSTRLATQQ